MEVEAEMQNDNDKGIGQDIESGIGQEKGNEIEEEQKEKNGNSLEIVKTVKTPASFKEILLFNLIVELVKETITINVVAKQEVGIEQETTDASMETKTRPKPTKETKKVYEIEKN